MKFRMTKIAAAIAAATMATSANAVVVVGGDNGWEVSFDGNVNAFYTHFSGDEVDTTITTAAGVVTVIPGTGAEDSSRVHSGFLPAFFSFNVKSPTVNGLTGKARFSFAPTIHRGKSGNDLYGTLTSGGSSGLQGASIDTREVLASVDGSFGTVSFGRTLSIFGRQAILHDMILFGVGNVTNNPDFGTVTAGRIGIGYIYPDFEARFSYATPNINGFKAEVGAFDPFEPVGLSGGPSGAETNIPRIEGEISYATSFTNGNLMVWGDGMWQEIDDAGGFGVGFNNDIDMLGYGGGAAISYLGFEIAGNYMQYEGSGVHFKGAAGGFPGATVVGLGSSFNCAAVAVAGIVSCEESEGDLWYVQGTYNFGQGTKVGFSYGEGNQDGQPSNATATNPVFAEVENTMWTIGVYHDVNAWLKLIAEYSNTDYEESTDFRAAGGTKVDTETGNDIFSVGSFITW
ncbi:MAG: porin [Chromatiales bacterium]